MNAISPSASAGWRALLKTGAVGAATVLVFVATVLLVVVGDGNPVLVLVPAILVAALYAAFTLPLRYSLYVFLVLVLTTENQNDASGSWKSPLWSLGVMIHTNLNVVIPIKALRFSGIDALCALFGAIVLYRRLTGNHIDRMGQTQTAKPIGRYVLLSLAAVLTMWAWGIVRGGDFGQTLWQMRQLLILPLVFFLFQAGLRGPKDFPALAKVIIFCALAKACLAYYVRHNVFPNDYQNMPTATSHDDSALFVGALAILLAHFVERVDRRRMFWLVSLGGVLALGMKANNRRLAWVELAMVALVYYLLSPMTPLKRLITRVAVASIPVIALYVAVGWNQEGVKIFKPVQLVRSVVDSNSDTSSQTRDIENFNLIWSLRQNPVLGLGFGHEYIEQVKGDDISQFFPQYRYIPHNSVLGIWAFGGVLGWTGLWLMTSVAVFLAMRSYRRTSDPMLRAAALSIVGVVVMSAIHGYGDMGFSAWTVVFTLAPAMAVAGKLAVATGAWPLRGSAGPGEAA